MKRTRRGLRIWTRPLRRAIFVRPQLQQHEGVGHQRPTRYPEDAGLYRRRAIFLQPQLKQWRDINVRPDTPRTPAFIADVPYSSNLNWSNGGTSTSDLIPRGRRPLSQTFHIPPNPTEAMAWHQRPTFGPKDAGHIRPTPTFTRTGHNRPTQGRQPLTETVEQLYARNANHQNQSYFFLHFWFEIAPN